MKRYFYKPILILGVLVCSFSFRMNAQTCEWRLVNPTYSSVDPDGAGPATGSVTFTMQIHTISGSIPNMTGISTGWSYQSSNVMLPTGAPCGITSIPQPVNVTMSPAFAGWTYNYVNECSGTVNFTTGGQTFDRRSAGTIDGGSLTITTAWMDIYTVTLWTLGTVSPEGGYVALNSGEGGSPGEFTTYAVADIDANGFPVNSLTYTTPLALGSGVAPVTFSGFNAKCTNKGTLVSWSTASEFNADYFEVQRSFNGNDWASVGRVKASGTSSDPHDYQLPDAIGGNSLYRVRQVDMDGHATYTSIIRTNCEVNNMGMVIYPVPAHNILNVVISSDKSVKTKLIVIDGVGRIVRGMEVNLFKGNNTFQFDLKGLSSGEYLIRSSDPGIDLNRKFNIAR